MKLSNYREDYYLFSGKASDVARNLAFAGIALVWIFKTAPSPDSIPRVPEELLAPTVFLVLTLIFDLLQYIFGSFVWGTFQWWQERQLDDLSEDPELDAPRWFKWPQFTCFVLKLCTIAVAYWLLLRYVSLTLFISSQ